jgi:hypothetical protein
MAALFYWLFSKQEEVIPKDKISIIKKNDIPDDILEEIINYANDNNGKIYEIDDIIIINFEEEYNVIESDNVNPKKYNKAQDDELISELKQKLTENNSRYTFPKRNAIKLYNSIE